MSAHEYTFYSADFIGAAADLGIIFERIEVDALDLNRGAAALNKLAGDLENTARPLAAAALIARHDMEKRFDSEIAPDGTKWRNLDIDYEERKIREVGELPILTRGTDSSNRKHARLRDVATEPENFTVSGDSVFYDTDRLASQIPYWRAHQQGNQSQDTSTGAVPGIDLLGLPARPYIGLSADAEAEIFDVFDLWFSDAIETATHRFHIGPTGVLQTRTLPGQRFGPTPIIA